MPLPSHKLMLLIVVAVFTLLTTWTDVKERKIYNWATLPMWLLGWVYQTGWFGWAGLLNGGLGCAVGFGLFFLLWTMKIAGGGDVKLMAALGVWLGFQQTTHTILASLAFVLTWQFVQAAAVDSKRTSRGEPAPSDQPVSSGRGSGGSQPRVQAFAPAVAAGTWTVLLAGWPL